MVNIRLWHYKLVDNDLLPKSQLIAEWRELNSIYAKEDNHILINYIYDYDKIYLLAYSEIVIDALARYNIKVRSFEKYNNYFKELKDYELPIDYKDKLMYKEHNDRYLMQNYMNLQEKFDRKQKDFDDMKYQKLLDFMYCRHIKK